MVFVGPKEPDFDHPNLKFYKSNVKPAQCCEAARRRCTGDIISWTADDAEYPEGILDDIAKILESSHKKTLVASSTIENGHLCPWDSFTLFDTPNSPVMAPFGFMYAEFANQLGGFDRRYVGGQYENDFLVRLYGAGGKVLGYTDKPIVVDHFNKHTDHHSNFSNFYKHGREVLENTWRVGGYCQNMSNAELLKEPSSQFQPFTDYRILEVTQGPQGLWT